MVGVSERSEDEVCLFRCGVGVQKPREHTSLFQGILFGAQQFTKLSGVCSANGLILMLCVGIRAFQQGAKVNLFFFFFNPGDELFSRHPLHHLKGSSVVETSIFMAKHNGCWGEWGYEGMIPIWVNLVSSRKRACNALNFAFFFSCFKRNFCNVNFLNLEVLHQTSDCPHAVFMESRAYEEVATSKSVGS